MSDGLSTSEGGQGIPLVVPAQVDQLAGMFVAVHAAHGHRGGARLGIGSVELVCDLVQGVTYYEVSVQQAFAARPQLLDLNSSQLPAAGQIRQDLLAHGLRRFNTFVTLLGCHFDDGRRFLLGGPAQLFCVGQSLCPNFVCRHF